MNFSEEFYSHIIENTTKENLFPDIIENIDDKDSLETLVRAGKSIKKFLGPPQILSCMEMERGISLYSVDKISKLAIYGGPGGILMEKALPFGYNNICKQIAQEIPLEAPAKDRQKKKPVIEDPEDERPYVN